LKTLLLVQFLENRLFDVVFGNEIGHWETAIFAARWNLLYLFCPVVGVLTAKFQIITPATPSICCHCMYNGGILGK
jgi:hypothetical protein